MRRLSLLILVPITGVASIHYQGIGFDIDTGQHAIYDAAGLEAVPIRVDSKQRFLFNRACRKDIYNSVTGKYITACSAMVLSSVNGRPGQQVGVVGFCNPHALTAGKQYTNQVMYMPNGGEQNCLFKTAAPNAMRRHGFTFSCPCHLPSG